MSEIWQFASAEIAIAERRYARLERLHVFQPDAGQVMAVSASLGIALDQTPNRVAGGYGRAVWLGPDEWLLIDRDVLGRPTLADANAPTSLLFDLAGGYFGLTISGSGALDLLARACPLDLHPRVFGPGQSAVSIFVQVPVVLIGIADGLELVFDISLRAYVLEWLTDALAVAS